MSAGEKYEEVRADLCVVGGGLAALGAAIAAARLGLKVSLVQDRPVLGGNSSSECRVWANGATGGRHNRYSREGGIMEEILLENKFRNPEGNAHLWDMVLQDWVKAEKNISLFLNTPAHGVEMAEPGRIAAMTARHWMTEKNYRFNAPLFFDGSGDGIVAFGAGASFRQGREAQSEYGESWAPAEADAKTLGNSIMFYSKDAGHPVVFRPPALARDFKGQPPPIVAQRVDPKDTRCCYWWIEYGGELDTIRDLDEIRDALWSIVYGVWDYIKNSGKYQDVENLDLEWVGSIPAKRESRRFLGDHVLIEKDLVEQRDFTDGVAHGGWSIDLHPPKGIFDERAEGSKHWHMKGPYQVPYRSLYSKDVENLFLGGRMVSASHVAFGTLRVQMTLAVLGQAAGTAAALCKKHAVSPRGVFEKHLPELRQTLLREDQWVIGARNADPADLALKAKASASSVHPASLEAGDESLPLDHDAWVRIPHSGRLDKIEFQVEGKAEAGWEIEVWRTERPENYVPHHLVKKFPVASQGSGRRWIELPLGLEPEAGQGLVFVFKEQPALKLVGSARVLSGIQGYIGTGKEWQWHKEWLPNFKLSPGGANWYGPDQAINGYSRPYGLPNAWVSDPMKQGKPEWLELAWDKPQEIGCVQLTFNSNLTPWYNSLVPQDDRVPEVVQDYVISVRQEGKYKEVLKVKGNYQRFRRHRFPPVKGDALRITVEKAGFGACAEIFEIRAYDRIPY